MESLDHLFSGPPVYLDSVEAVYGPTSRVVFPTVTREVWADMVRCFPGLRSVRYPSRGSYRVLSFRLDQLGDSEDSLHSTLIVRGHYARGRVRFDRESTREFSIYKDDTLVARTLVRGDHCAWLYLQDTILDQCHRCPVVLIKMPSLAKYLTQAQITEALSSPCQCFECTVLDERHHPCTFGTTDALEFSAPGMVRLLQNCQASRRILCEPSFDIPLSLNLRFQGTIQSLHSSVSVGGRTTQT